ncbi:hypothetical protein B9R42_05920 [Arthrospira platensis PCC 7345]
MRSLYSTKGLKSPPGGYFGYCNPISCLNVSHFFIDLYQKVWQPKISSMLGFRATTSDGAGYWIPLGVMVCGCHPLQLKS